jgi:putative polyketide hydroxylase
MVSDDRRTMLEVPVLVAGAGPAGLTAAIELARRGVESLVVDRRTGLSALPRATGISTRVMELLRTWGLETEVLQGAVDVEWLGWIGETLAAPAGSAVPVGFPTREQSALISPTGPACVAQSHLEAVLLTHLGSLGPARVELGAEVTGVEPEPDGVRVTLDGGRTVRAQHLVAADGIRSTVRTALGIELRGPGPVAERVAVQFRAPLWERLGDRRHVIYMLSDGAAVIPAGSGDHWVYAVAWDPTRERLEDYTQERVIELIRRAAGIPDLEATVDAIDAVTFGAELAERFRAGRVFLTGDAAHRMAPRGATGMNTAILSGHDLGWKLAWVHRGWAGDELLDTYETERRPVAEHNIARSADPNGSLRGVDEGLQVDLGGRIPHLWLPDGSSTLDVLGPGLTRFTGPEGADVNGHVPPVTVRALPAMHARALGIRPGGSLLVRPDGVPA